MMKKLNWPIIESNIREATSELKQLCERMTNGEFPKESEFEISLRHAYHHLNVAWNVRHVATRDYRNLIQENFHRWGKYPCGLDEL